MVLHNSLRGLYPGDHTLLVQVPSNYVYEYLEQHYVGLLSKVLTRCFGTSVRLRYRIVTDKEHNLSQDIEGDEPLSIDEPKPITRANKAPSVLDTAVPQELNPQLNPPKNIQQLYRRNEQQTSTHNRHIHS